MKVTLENYKEVLEVEDVSKIDWRWVAEHEELSEAFIEKYADKVDWELISEHQELSEMLIEKYADRVSWWDISRSQKLSEPFIEKYADMVNWEFVSEYQKLSEPFIEKFADQVDWCEVSINQTLSEPFIEKFADQVDWCEVSINQTLSEPFIEKFVDKVDWREVSAKQPLSEPFIEKFADRLDWAQISRYQVLSEPFIEEFSDRLDWAQISRYQVLSEPFIEKFSDRLDWKQISGYQNLSKSFIRKHSDKLFFREIPIAVVHNCGKKNRAIRITCNSPEMIEVGCFLGTKEETIKRIGKKYTGEEAEAYIGKVDQCFAVAQEKMQKAIRIAVPDEKIGTIIKDIATIKNMAAEMAGGDRHEVQIVTPEEINSDNQPPDAYFYVSDEAEFVLSADFIKRSGISHEESEALIEKLLDNSHILKICDIYGKDALKSMVSFEALTFEGVAEGIKKSVEVKEAEKTQKNTRQADKVQESSNELEQSQTIVPTPYQ